MKRGERERRRERDGLENEKRGEREKEREGVDWRMKRGERERERGERGMDWRMKREERVSGKRESWRERKREGGGRVFFLPKFQVRINQFGWIRTHSSKDS